MKEETEFVDLLNDIADAKTRQAGLKVLNGFIRRRFGELKGNKNREKQIEYGALVYYGKRGHMVVDKRMVDLSRWPSYNPKDIGHLREAVVDAGLCLHDWKAYLSGLSRIGEDTYEFGLNQIRG